MDIIREKIGTGTRPFTSYGTSLFVDTASTELRHGPVEGSPPNVLLTLDGDVARLKFVGPDGVRNIAFAQDSSAVIEASKIAGAKRSSSNQRELSLISIENTCEFGLTAAGKFVSALPDGKVILSVPHLREWERFHTRVDHSELTGTIISQRIDGQMIHFFINNRKDRIQRDQCRGDFFEREALDIIRAHYRPDRVFVDVGANIGNHAIFVSKFCGASEVIVFEPNPGAIRILAINLALNGCSNVNTNYVGLALSSEEKRVRAFEPWPNNLGGAQMLKDDEGDIKCVRGDDVLVSRPTGFIKIDVEGMEFEVLGGLQQTIERWRPVIFVEVWKEGCNMLKEWCKEFRYSVRREVELDNYLLYPSERS